VHSSLGPPPHQRDVWQAQASGSLPATSSNFDSVRSFQNVVSHPSGSGAARDTRPRRLSFDLPRARLVPVVECDGATFVSQMQIRALTVAEGASRGSGRSSDENRTAGHDPASGQVSSLAAGPAAQQPGGAPHAPPHRLNDVVETLARRVQASASEHLVSALQLEGLRGVGSMGTVYTATLMGQRIVCKVRPASRAAMQACELSHRGRRGGGGCCVVPEQRVCRRVDRAAHIRVGLTHM
jgi:hypothetical protein